MATSQILGFCSIHFELRPKFYLRHDVKNCCSLNVGYVPTTNSELVVGIHAGNKNLQKLRHNGEQNIPIFPFRTPIFDVGWQTFRHKYIIFCYICLRQNRFIYFLRLLIPLESRNLVENCKFGLLHTHKYKFT